MLYDEDDKTREIANGLIGDDILTKLARYEMNLANRISRTINQLLQLRAACVEADEKNTAHRVRHSTGRELFRGPSCG